MFKSIVRCANTFGGSLTNDYGDAGCLRDACILTTAETRGNSGRDSPGSLLVSHCQLSEAKPSVKGILVPIFCPYVLRILYNTGISCCEKAGQWQLAATTLATIIEETASFKRV